MSKIRYILPGDPLVEPKLLVAKQHDIEINLDISDAAYCLNKSRHNQDFSLFLLANQALEILLEIENNKTPTLLSLERLKDNFQQLGLIPYSHQLECVRCVIEEMNGQAILADEVGLGKTIEAGLIIREYFLRDLVEKVLILTPASLTRQWEWELRQKLGLRVFRQRTILDWQNSRLLVASLETAKREPHASLVKEVNWDMVIVDEAHRLKNHKTQAYRFVSELKKKHLLLITATPMQNNLRELFNLVQLIAPGTLGSLEEFSAKYSLEAKPNLEQIKQSLKPFLIRTTRKEAFLDLPQRDVSHVPCVQDKAEKILYQALSEYILTSLKKDQSNYLTLVTLQKELCSSIFAALLTLEKMLNRAPDPILGEIVRLGVDVKINAKTKYLLEELPSIGEKIVIFTEYLATQKFLANELSKRDLSFVTYDGTLSSSKKEWAKERFRRDAQILLATQAGGEGLNLQFCQNIINYDLPWNPMKIEQRIGRIHRLGQKKPVKILNLFTKDTIEERILELLYHKLKLFTDVFSLEEETLGQDLTHYIVTELLDIPLTKELSC